MHINYLSLAVAASAGLVASRAIPESHVVHERRDISYSKWTKRDRVQPHVRVPVRIGLKQNPEAFEKAQDWLNDVSHPASEKYGQHWTQDEIIEAFQPAQDSVDAVLEWISSVGGIAKHKITHTQNKAWLAFDASIEDMERLVQTEFHEHRHEASGRAVISCDEYHVPKHIQEHIDYITPGVKGIHVESGELKKRYVPGTSAGTTEGAKVVSVTIIQRHR